MIRDDEVEAIESILGRSQKLKEKVEEMHDAPESVRDISKAHAAYKELEAIIRDLPEGRLMSYLNFSNKVFQRKGVFQGIMYGVGLSALAVLFLRLII